MKRCFCCARRYPLWMFRNVRTDWYSRDGKLQCCRLCNVRRPDRYRKEPTGRDFPKFKLVGYELPLWERIKEMFEP